MIEYFAEALLPLWQDLDHHLVHAENNLKASPGDTVIGDGTKKDMFRILEEIRPICFRAELTNSSSRTMLFYRILLDGVCCTNRTLATEIKNLQDTIDLELSNRRFAFIPTDKADFFEQEELFGKAVHDAFPSAQVDIKEAGNCFASGLNTAAVFHFMRVAEFGMRALALHLKVKLKRKPIEHGGWNELIEQIEKKIRLRRERYDKSRRKSKKELEFLKFCRTIADELFFFKNIWRDNTMHAISNYRETEAKGVFERVRDFMQRLAKIIPMK
jgi:hypothetical protein